MRMIFGLILVLTACSQATTALGDGDVSGGVDDAMDVHFGTDAAAPADAAPDAVKDAATDGQTQPDLGQSDLSDGQTQPEDGQSGLSDGQTQPDLGQSDLSDGQTQPDLGQSDLSDGQTQPEDGQSGLSDGQTQPEDGQTWADVLSDATDAIADVVDDVVAVPDVTVADVPVLAEKAGCSDGTREGFGDQAIFPAIAACGGAWDQPGIFNMPDKCSNQAGNDGANAAGTGCTVSDLCAVGWHVCYGKDDVLFRNPDGCAGVMTGATPPVFFTTQMSSTGAFQCASGANATNDLFGCGNLGCDFTGNATVKTMCAPLGLSSHDMCKGLRNDKGCGDWCNHLGKYPSAPNSWDCGGDGDKEALNVVKSHPEQQGGVLCCLD